MDGFIRLMAFTARDRADLEKRRADEAFRALHRHPDALPDEPSDVTRDRGPVRRLVRLIARIDSI